MTYSCVSHNPTVLPSQQAGTYHCSQAVTSGTSEQKPESLKAMPHPAWSGEVAMVNVSIWRCRRVRELHFVDIVEVQQLLEVMAQDAAPVAERIQRLLLPSYFPGIFKTCACKGLHPLSTGCSSASSICTSDHNCKTIAAREHGSNTCCSVQYPTPVLPSLCSAAMDAQAAQALLHGSP